MVTIICLCYNQAKYVREALESALNQTYKNIQLIVVDDGSTDDSKIVINELVRLSDAIQFISLSENLGNCKAFNKALELSEGEFVIDLAADDILLPSRVERGVHELIRRGKTYGVNFTNADIISQQGHHLNYFYPIDENGKSKNPVSQGDLFVDLVKRYFICSPTMMFTREVLDELGGYDEELSYEDFDFWIRSSRKFKYCYTDEVLVKKRLVASSKSSGQFKFRSADVKTTYNVIKKIFSLTKTEDELKAFRRRTIYELLMALRHFNFRTAFKYLTLLSINK